MTTNSDDEIKRYLKQQSQELDSMLGEGLTDYLKLGFDSRFSGLMKLGYAIAIALSIVLFYCGYQFFNAPGADQVFWRKRGDTKEYQKRYCTRHEVSECSLHLENGLR